MRNHQRGEGDAGSEKHSGEDQTNDADGYPEAGTCRGRGRADDRSGRWGRRDNGGFRHGVLRRSRNIHIGGFVRNYKTISFAGNRLDVERLVRGIAEDLAKFVYGCVDVGVVVDVRVRGPEALAQFFARDDLARLVEERDQDLIHLALQLNARAVPGDFLALLVHLKRTKTRKTRS